jgi:hypothetical protein
MSAFSLAMALGWLVEVLGRVLSIWPTAHHATVEAMLCSPLRDHQLRRLRLRARWCSGEGGFWCTEGGGCA